MFGTTSLCNHTYIMLNTITTNSRSGSYCGWSTSEDHIWKAHEPTEEKRNIYTSYITNGAIMLCAVTPTKESLYLVWKENVETCFIYVYMHIYVCIYIMWFTIRHCYIYQCIQICTIVSLIAKSLCRLMSTTYFVQLNFVLCPHTL